MAIVVFAGKHVGHQCLDFLLSAGFPVAYVVVAHDSDADLLALASRAQVPHHVFGSRDKTLGILRTRKFDWLLNLWSSHILSPALLSLADHRLNIHPSYAPHGLGSDSATWMIREKTTPGVSLLEMGPDIDTGGVYARQSVAWNFPEPAKVLFERLKQAAITLFKDRWNDIYAGRLDPVAQSGSGSYHTTKMTRADRCLDGGRQMSAEEFVHWALAHDFAPQSSPEIVLNSVKYKLTISLQPLTPIP